eukprot:PRCOL_00000506-RA
MQGRRARPSAESWWARRSAAGSERRRQGPAYEAAGRRMALAPSAQLPRPRSPLAPLCMPCRHIFARML